MISALKDSLSILGFVLLAQMWENSMQTEINRELLIADLVLKVALDVNLEQITGLSVGTVQ